MNRPWFRAARWLWWSLPPSARDSLRPVLFAPAGFRAGFAGRLGGRPDAPSWKLRPAGVRARTAGSAFARAASVASVAVVIPARDAGPLFRRVLASLRSQSGVGEIEILVLDSGSTDTTCNEAGKAGATVVRLAPGEFGHGRTRNQGAELASSEVLVMLAQDAVLLGPDVLRTLVLELSADPSNAAVSARQVPRSDADLYASFVILSHGRTIADASNVQGQRPLRELSPMQQRAAAGVDNVCSAISRTAWQELRFEDLPFAEDLDFGLRAVDQGWRVVRSSAAAVAHSHTRSAVYSLRRSAADRICLAPLIGDRRLVRASTQPAGAVLSAGRGLVGEVAAALEAFAGGAAPLIEQLQGFRSALAARPASAEPAGELARLDAFLAAEEHGVEARTVRLLRDDLLAFLTWPLLLEFARPHRWVEPDEAASFVAKLTAAVIGRAVGDATRAGHDAVAAGRLLEGI